MRRLAIACAALVLAASCGRGAKVFDAHGVVEEVQRENQQVLISHDDIPGLMPGMTMNFDVPDPQLLARLAPGQTIDFKLEFTGKAYRVIDATIRATGSATRGGASLAGAPADAEPAPPFHLIDQDGKPLALEDLRGKTVLLDFIYTRCPGPCPILTGIHAKVQKELSPELRAKTHFASISLDPTRDTPEVLREYAEKRGADLGPWSFLTGAPADVDAVVKSYGVGSARSPDGGIEHVVVTFLIDPNGRIRRRYLGLDGHDPKQIERDLQRLVDTH